MAAADGATAESRLAYCRGIVTLAGPAVDRVASAGLGSVPAAWQQQRCKRDGDGFHITAFSKQDLQLIARGLREGSLQLLQDVKTPDPEDLPSVAEYVVQSISRRPGSLTWIDVGEGRVSNEDGESAFRVVMWPAAAAARSDLGLAAQDFHISLGFRSSDLHGKCKGLPSLVAGAVDRVALQPLLQTARQLLEATPASAVAGASGGALDDAGVKALATAALEGARAHADAAAEEVAALRVLCQLFGRLKMPEQSLEVAEQLTELDTDDEVGSRSLAFALMTLQRFEAALPVLKRLHALLPALAPGKEREQLEKWLPGALQKCRRKLGLPESEPLFPGPEDRANEEWDTTFEDAFCSAEGGGKSELKFPSTAHLKNLGAATKDDKLCSAERVKVFCGSGRAIYAEEKIDGANLGISLDSSFRWRMQGRGKWVNWNTDPQFAGLEEWLNEHRATLAELLERNNDILFGEWCAARHTVKYTGLPTYFLAFDIYDWRAGRFLSRQSFHTRLQRCSAGPKIAAVPMISNRQTFASTAEVEALLQRTSHFANEFVEGAYLRVDEEPTSQDGGRETYLLDRCKLVRKEFQQHIESHGTWRGSGRNGLDMELAMSYAEQSYPCALAASTVVGSSSVAASSSSAAVAPEASAAQGLRVRLTNPREKHMVGNVELPRNFSFLLDDLAVSSEPRSRDQIMAMGGMGIGLVVTLTEETPLLPEWFAGTVVSNLFVPVPNYHPPTSQQVHDIFAQVAAVVFAGRKVMVHCGGGKGRAGTVAACLMCRFGTESIRGCLELEKQQSWPHLCALSSSDLTAYLREQRPGSIETYRQEHFLRDFVSDMRRRGAEDPEALLLGRNGASAATAEERVAGTLVVKVVVKTKLDKDAEKLLKDVQKRAPKFIMMVGLVASGKSTFSKALADSELYVRANQDEHGRDGCEELVKKTVPSVRSGKARVVLDRCHLTREERAEWLQVCGGPKPEEVLCVFFDMPAEDCKRRAAARADHPTIRAGGGGRIIDAQAKQLETPDKSEGFGVVERVQSFAQAAALLRRLGVDAPDVADVVAPASVEDQVDGDENDDPVPEEPHVEEGEVASRDGALPPAFAAWLRLALSEEMGADDADGIFAAAQVILEGAAADPEALPSCIEVLQDSGAASTAERLEARWKAAA
mmetsp:Transcript_51518/g.130947  ORF Transcript_51518/g.130947 Transcript_51518/m.130947 type:complete len:1157 (-) Transcript_51518:39-3509(-)